LRAPHFYPDNLHVPFLGGWVGAIPPGYPAGESNLASLSRRMCRWLQLIHKGQLAPLENAPFSTPWARKRCSVAQRFRQY
jgi:hypothetical protein